MAIAAASGRVAFGLTLPVTGGAQRKGVTIRRLLFLFSALGLSRPGACESGGRSGDGGGAAGLPWCLKAWPLPVLGKNDASFLSGKG